MQEGSEIMQSYEIEVVHHGQIKVSYPLQYVRLSPMEQAYEISVIWIGLSSCNPFH